jgi:hypothetical protein
MNEIAKDEVFATLNRITATINGSPLMQKLSHLVDVKFGVVGGAVRDLYLDRPIKDIDIVVSLDFKKDLEVKYPERRSYRGSDYDEDDELLREQSAEADALEKRNTLILESMGKPVFEFMHDFLLKKDKPPTAIQAMVYLIRKIIESNQDYGIVKVYDKNNSDMPLKDVKLRENAYEEIGLCAVIAIKDKHTDYPIELLFTPDDAPSFLKCFDFNLCKAYMVNNDEQAKIVLCPEFEQDVQNKTITYTPNKDLTEEKMNKSIFVRYERLQQKYPEYTLVADISAVGSPDLKKMVENTIKTVSFYHQLNTNTKQKEETSSSRRPKKI